MKAADTRISESEAVIISGNKAEKQAEESDKTKSRAKTARENPCKGPVNTRKVAVIGCGFVGSSIAFTLMQRSIFSEMVLIDRDRKKAEGEALDNTILWLRFTIITDKK